MASLAIYVSLVANTVAFHARECESVFATTFVVLVQIIGRVVQRQTAGIGRAVV